MIEHILVAVGNDGMDVDAMADHVAEIATGVGAEVTLFRAFTEQELSEWLDEMSYDSTPPKELAQRHGVVNSLADRLGSADVSLRVEGSVGTPADEVVNYVQNYEVDHVFLGGRRRSPAGKALLGSVSQQVLLRVDVPCTLVLEE